MSAPGDIVILLGLLAAFVACAGYAAGRIHQRRQHGPEREAAYQNGYDTATRSVFSMAARAAGRRRGKGTVHASAGVPPKEEPTEPAPPGPAVTETAIAADESPTRPVPQQVAFPAPRPHTIPGLPQPGAAGGVTYTAVPDPRSSGLAETLPGQRAPREGRHMVPEELVRAATYRLPADRVARARVVPPAEAEDPTVPHPRGV